MKRNGLLYTKICDILNIRIAAYKSITGKRINKSKLDFIDNHEYRIQEVHEMLLNKTYTLGPLYLFVIYEPKERIIHCPPFYPDRIIHHALMNIILPLLIKKFNRDAYGSIKGRGLAMAAHKIQKAVKNKDVLYYLQIDIRKFYESIDHDILKQELLTIIKCKDTLKLCFDIIDCHDLGLAIGEFPSQYFANVMLYRFDRWIKETLKLKYYYRYMDDMLWLVGSKEEAKAILQQVREKLKNLKLTIKDNIRIAPIRTGINFIGYVFYPDYTKLRKSIKINMKRKDRKLRKMNVDDKTYKFQMASFHGWCCHCNARHLEKSIYKERAELLMNYPRYSQIKEKVKEDWFGVDSKDRISVDSLLDQDIIIFDCKTVYINNENKLLVLFEFPDKEGEKHTFLTKAKALNEDLPKDKEHMPFITQLKKIKNKTNNKFHLAYV